MLRTAAHPGVVEFLSNHECAVEGAAGYQLTTGFAGSHTLDTVEPLSPGQLAGIFSALSTVIDDLHRVGIVHGNLTLEHVIVSGQGRPIVCSFGRASRHDITAASVQFQAAVSADVAALGECLGRMIPRTATPANVGVGRAKTRSQAAHQSAIRALQRIAADCQAPDHQIATAHELARRFTADVPDAGLPHNGIVTEAQDAAWQRFDAGKKPELVVPPSSLPRSSKPSPKRLGLGAGPGAGADDARRRKVAIAGIAVAALVAVGGVIAINPGGSSPANPGAAFTSAPATVIAASASFSDNSLVPTTVAAPTTAPPTLLAPTSQPDPTGSAPTTATPCQPQDCPRISAPGTVIYNGATYKIGEADDTILLADWRCGGAITAAVFRQSTGAIVMFDGWATTVDVTARPIGKIANAISAFVQRDNNQCPHLMVETSDAALREIDTIGASS